MARSRLADDDNRLNRGWVPSAGPIRGVVSAAGGRTATAGNVGGCASGRGRLLVRRRGAVKLAGFLPSMIEIASSREGLHTLYVSPSGARG